MTVDPLHPDLSASPDGDRVTADMVSGHPSHQPTSVRSPEPDLERLRGEIQAEFMDLRDDLDNDDVRRLTLFLYLIPVIGFFPAVWTLYRRLGDRHQQSVSRLSVTLAMGWLLSYLMVNLGATTTSPNVALPLLIVSSLLTSGYFLVNIGLMIQLLRRKRLWLPVISRWSDRLP